MFDGSLNVIATSRQAKTCFHLTRWSDASASSYASLTAHHQASYSWMFTFLPLFMRLGGLGFELRVLRSINMISWNLSFARTNQAF